MNIDKILKEKDYKEFLRFINIPIREKFLVKETLKVEKIILEKAINRLDNKKTIDSEKIKMLLSKQLVTLEEKIQKIVKDLDKNQKEKLFEKYTTMYMNHLFDNSLVWLAHTKEEMEKIEIYDEICLKSRRKNSNHPMNIITKKDYAEDFSILCSNDDNNRITSGYLMTGRSIYDGQEANHTILNSYLTNFLEGEQVDTIENYYTNYMSTNYTRSKKQNTTRAKNINKYLYTVIIGAYQHMYSTLKDDIYKIYHNGYSKEEVEKMSEEKESLFIIKDFLESKMSEEKESLFIIKDFLESKMSRNRYCSIKNISKNSFNRAVENIKKIDGDLYKEVAKKLNQGRMTFLNEMHEVKQYLKFYDPRKKNLTLIDYYAITNRPISEVLYYYKNDKEVYYKANLFKRVTDNKSRRVNYKEIEEAKISINGKELTQTDKDNIKNFIKKEGYPNIQGIYLEVRKAYLENNLKRVEKEAIRESLKNKFAKEKKNTPNEQKQKKYTRK